VQVPQPGREADLGAAPAGTMPKHQDSVGLGAPGCAEPHKKQHESKTSRCKTSPQGHGTTRPVVHGPNLRFSEGR